MANYKIKYYFDKKTKRVRKERDIIEKLKLNKSDFLFLGSYQTVQTPPFTYNGRPARKIYKTIMYFD